MQVGERNLRRMVDFFFSFQTPTPVVIHHEDASDDNGGRWNVERTPHINLERFDERSALRTAFFHDGEALVEQERKLERALDVGRFRWRTVSLNSPTVRGMTALRICTQEEIQSRCGSQDRRKTSRS